MRLSLGIALSLLAGCAMQPPASGRPRTPADGGSGPTLSTTGNALCLGVEYLPPAACESSLLGPMAAPPVEAIPAASPRPISRALDYRPAARVRGDRHTWTMSADELATVDDPAARETLHFLDDLMGEDRRRLQREIGTPVLTIQATDLQSPGIDLRAEQIQADEESQWLADNGLALLRRPLQRLLRRTPLVQALQLQLDDFKEDNVPLSEEYSRAHSDADLGRVSVRLRPGATKDQAELVYMHSGVRVGSSRDTLKLGFSRDLTERLAFEVRARQGYGDHQWHVRADLAWELSSWTSLHFVAGDDMDFLATSTVYSLFESPMDGTPGLLVYAVHLF